MQNQDFVDWSHEYAGLVKRHREQEENQTPTHSRASEGAMTALDHRQRSTTIDSGAWDVSEVA